MSENNGTHKKVIIIGSGPAGLTAALYAARAKLNPLVLEGTQPGGQLTITTDVENYPGFPDGILGPELMDKMRQQASKFGADCRYETVSEVNFSERPFKIKTEKDDYTGDTVIISTGASAQFLGVPGEEEYMGRGVSACATCDGFFLSDQEIVAVGGGDAALEEATYLTKVAKTVHVVHRRDELLASNTLLVGARKRDKGEIISGSVLWEGGAGEEGGAPNWGIAPGVWSGWGSGDRPLGDVTGGRRDVCDRRGRCAMVQHGAAGRIRQCRTCRTSYDQDPPFRDLDRLDNGDLIFVTDGSGFEVMHRVSDTFIVDPTDLWITYDTGASTLTMFACHPKGSERFRIMVRADLVAGRRIA